MNTIETDDIPYTSLRERLVGALFTRQSADWVRESRTWNLAVTGEPLAVVLAAEPTDVAEALRFAAAHGLDISPQGAGHGASDRREGTLVVRTDGLTTIDVDLASRTALVGAGVRMGALQEALDGTGLTAPSGSSPSVTVAGIALGGGYSWFTRSSGSVAASIVSVDLMDADGERRQVDDASDPDLMWALRGGTGRGVIVVAVRIALQSAQNLAGGRLLFPATARCAVVDAYAHALGGDTATSLWLTSLRFPDAAVVPPEVRGQAFVAVDGVSTAGVEALEHALAGVRRAGPVLRDTVRPLRPSEVGGVAEEPADPTPALQRGLALGALSPAAVAAFLGATASPSPLTMVQLRDLSGVRDVGVDGAATVARSEVVLNAMGIAPGPEAVRAVRGALDDLAGDLAVWAEGALVPTFVAPWRTLADAFDGEERSRLERTARRTDPSGRIRAALV